MGILISIAIFKESGLVVISKTQQENIIFVKIVIVLNQKRVEFKALRSHRIVSV